MQKHIRLIAVLESLDNGKSIRETRDADAQIVARHLYHHAGWAELMETEMKGTCLVWLSTQCSKGDYKAISSNACPLNSALLFSVEANIDNILPL